MKIINSKDNKTYKFLKSLLQKKYRKESRLFPVEGSVVLSEIDRDFKYLCMSKTYYEKLEDKDVKEKVLVFDDNLFKDLCDTQNPQGILAYFDFIEKDAADLPDCGKFLYLDDLQDPGNVGTLIRTCDALSMDGLIVSPETVDLYSPKLVRSSMASLFRLPIYRLDKKSLLKCRKNFKIYATALHGAKDLRSITFEKNSILILGNEARGVSKDLLEGADEKISIRMREGVDSLNVAISGGIIIYSML